VARWAGFKKRRQLEAGVEELCAPIKTKANDRRSGAFGEHLARHGMVPRLDSVWLWRGSGRQSRCVGASIAQKAVAVGGTGAVLGIGGDVISARGLVGFQQDVKSAPTVHFCEFC